jgi:hypothetical protein
VSLWEAGDLGCGVICEMRSGLAQPFAPLRGMMQPGLNQTATERLEMSSLTINLTSQAEASIIIELAKRMEELRAAFDAPASRRGGYIRF